MKLKFYFLLLFGFISFSFAAEEGPLAGEVNIESSKKSTYYLGIFNELRNQIPVNAYNILVIQGQADAKAARLLALENESSQSPLIPIYVRACSLYVEILRKEIDTEKARMQIAENWEKRIAVMKSIETTQEHISELRSGQVSTLATDLEAERLRLAQTSEEMKQQQDRLQAEMLKTQEDAKNREEELKKALEEEKKKAEARQQEAKNKLNKLQSRLIQVTQDARGIILSMSDILFDVDKASLKGDLKTSLAKVAGILSVYQELNISVEGHTDDTGSDDYNMKLSEQRAQNVKEFLMSQGIDESRLSSKGYGKTMPVASNKTKKGKQKNRRVDLVIQDKTLLEP